MITVSIISLVFSFLLQGLMSNIFNFNIGSLSIFCTIYLVVNMVVLQQYFDYDKKYLIIISIFGLMMDIVYSSTALFNVFIFIGIFYLNKILTSFLPYNLLTINFFAIISVFFYHIVTFIFLKILNFDTYSIYTLFKILYSNIIMTIIYTSILYYVIDYIYKKFDLKIIRE